MLLTDFLDTQDMVEFRGLTLHRPWPETFYLPENSTPGPKRVENRAGWWPRAFTLPMQNGIAEKREDRTLWLALHSGGKLDTEALSWIQNLGLPDFQGGAGGVITGVTKLKRVLDIETLGFQHPLVVNLSPWVFGRYAWEVEETRQLSQPIPCTRASGVKCFQGLWRLPPRILEQLR
jgi:hypothetical protein